MSFVAFFQFILSVETFLTGDWPLLFQIQQSGEWRILDFNSPLGCYDIMLITYSYCSCPTSSWPIKQTIVKRDLFSLIYRYNVYEISVCARGEFQSKTNVFHGFTTVQYS